jgi:hypothetical protein
LNQNINQFKIPKLNIQTQNKIKEYKKLLQNLNQNNDDGQIEEKDNNQYRDNLDNDY